MTVAILAEKNSAARNMAKALGGAKGNYKGEDYIIVAARGHLYELKKPEHQVRPELMSQYKDWSLEHMPWDLGDFSWELEPREGTRDVISVLRRELPKVDEIAIATDVDPTGEGGLIATEVITELGLQGKKISRMYFTDEAASSIQKAFTSRKAIPDLEKFDEHLMATVRSRFDFATMQFTRIATKAAAQPALLRQGRLKSAMVKIVGDGLKAHNEYVKKPFYENRFRDENGVIYSNGDEPRFEDKNDVPQSYSTSPVITDDVSNKRKAPPRLLDLAGLSAILSGKGISAQVVLATYQKMYEAQIVSYPRTEDKTITTEQFKEMLPLVDDIARVVGADPSLLTVCTPRRTHVKDSGAHGANRPGPNVPGSLDELEKKFGKAAPAIYELLARSYLTMLAEDYVYERHSGHLEKYPDFTGAVNVPLSPGYKAIFAVDDDDEDEEASTQGLGKSADPFVHEGFPPRPPHPSMKWLMKQLEKRDVGTGATRTSIYAEVTNAKAKNPLLIEKRGKITMSEFGQMSYGLLPNTRIGDLSVTEYLQKEMREVAAGTKTSDEVLAVVADWVRDDITTMQANGVQMRKELGLSEMVQREKATGIWSETGDEVSFNRVWGANDHWDGHRFTDAEVQALLNDKVVAFDATSKSGNSYRAIGKLGASDFKGKTFIGFQMDFDLEDPDGFQVPKVIAKKTLTDSERADLAAGKRITVKGLTSKKGSKFDAPLVVAEEDGKKKIVFDFDGKYEK